MKRLLRIRLLDITLFAIALSLTACGGPNTGIKVDGDVPVDVAIEPSLESVLQVTSKAGKKPGKKNPIEVSVTVKNTDIKEHRILFDGKWQNDSGQGYGGTSDSRTLPAGSSTTFTAGTRSGRATKMVLKIAKTNLDAEQLAAKTISQVKPAVPGYGLSYIATPTLDQIPNLSPKGTANGAPFVAGTIMIAPINGTWELQVIDRKIDPLKGIAFAKFQEGNAGIQIIHLNLPAEPETGKVFERNLDYGGGYWQIQTSPGASETTSWNTKIAWVVEIKEWNRQPYNTEAGGFQQGGTVSGRLYICFKGSDLGMKDSFVAGVFENAPIVYYGNPDRKVASLR